MMLAYKEVLSPSLSAVRISGDILDASAALTFASQVDQISRSGTPAVLVDLGAPAHCAHSGLAGLIETCARLSGTIRIGLCNTGEAVRTKLRDYGFDRALTVFDSIDAALLDPRFQVFRIAGMKAVVLCAGEGRRMRPMTRFVPKPMLDVAGKPVIVRILDHLERFGLNDVLLNPGFLGPQIPAHLRHREGRQRLHFVAEGRQSPVGWKAEPLGSLTTLARLNSNHFAFSDDTFVLCGDALIDIDLADMLALHRKTGAAITIASKAIEPDLVSNYGVLVTDSTGRVTSFQEKPSRDQALSLLANTGIYIFRLDVLHALQEVPSQDIATDLFPVVLHAGLRMQAYTAPFNWSDIGCGRTYYGSVADVVKGRLPADRPHGELLSDGIWIGPGASVSPRAQISGECYIGAGARIEDGARIEGTSVVGSGCIVESNALVRDSIVWGGTRVSATLDQVIAGQGWAVEHRFADGHQEDTLRSADFGTFPTRQRHAILDKISLAS